MPSAPSSTRLPTIQKSNRTGWNAMNGAAIVRSTAAMPMLRNAMVVAWMSRPDTNLRM